MKFRSLSPAGDWSPCLRSADLQTGKQAVSSAIRSRFTLFHGEWWENRDLGFTLPRSAEDITAYIAAAPGVTSVTDICYVPGRGAAYTCTAHTADGAAEVSVTL